MEKKQCTIPANVLLAAPFYLERKWSPVKIRLTTTHLTGGDEAPVFSKQGFVIPELEDEEDYESIIQPEDIGIEFTTPTAPQVDIKGDTVVVNWPSYKRWQLDEDDTY